jgi:predicted DNA-binding transcriptional regulator YafY
MRADRLVATLLLLQRRGRVTAAEVAAELEISERTARRDLEALGMAGLPVFSRQGRNGGWELAGGGRTDLSGLTADETRALFLVAGPSSNVTPEVKAALRKLVRALPESLRDQAESASSALVVDPRGWDQDAVAHTASPRHLDDVQRAVVDGEQIEIAYVARDGSETSRPVHPLGIAAKGSRWYLVADTSAGLRTFRVDRIRSVETLGAKVVRPDGFELASAWRLIADEVDQKRTPVHSRALVRAPALGLCRFVFGTRLRIGPAAPDGRIEVELRGHSAGALAGEVAGLGAAVEVLDPEEVVEELRRVAAELHDLYLGRPVSTDEVRIDIVDADDWWLIDVLSGWHWREWANGDPNSSIEEWRARLAARTGSDGVPFTLVAWHGDDPVGSLSVCWDDGDDDYPDDGPWFTGVYVLGAARDLGVGRALVTAAEALLLDAGHDEVWLHTGEAQRFYERCGYEMIRGKGVMGEDAVLRRVIRCGPSPGR